VTCDINNKDCPYYKDGRCTFEETCRPRIVAVDLDDTIFEYNGWRGHNHFGEPILSRSWGEVLDIRDRDGQYRKMHPAEALREFKNRGWVVVIWTTRNNRDRIAEELRKHNIPFDYINEHPWQPPDTSGKLFADLYIDDRAFRFERDPEDCW